eukprot:g259.t1
MKRVVGFFLLLSVVHASDASLRGLTTPLLEEDKSEDHSKCPYHNGHETKLLRAKHPYEMFAQEDSLPKFLPNEGAVEISVAYQALCADEVNIWSGTALLGGPMNVFIPIRTPVEKPCLNNIVMRREERVRIPVPSASLDDPRALFVGFPENSLYDVYIVREAVESAEDSLQKVLTK